MQCYATPSSPSHWADKRTAVNEVTIEPGDEIQKPGFERSSLTVENVPAMNTGRGELLTTC